MEYRLMGATGLTVSRLCLGTMTFGHETDIEGSHAQLDRFVEAGGNFIDTADVYSSGESERIIGSWLASRGGMRDQVVLATKGRFPMAEHPNGVGLSRRHLRDALDASLTRLGVESIDLYQMHAYDPLTPFEETLRFVDDAISAGKVHYFGLSNFLGWQIASLTERALSSGLTPPVMLQPQYNLLVRHIELEIVPACAEYGIGLMPWSPLGGGWLTGKYKRGQTPTGATRLGENLKRGMEGWDRRSEDERVWTILGAVEKVAEQTGKTMAQVSLAWLADRHMVVSPIIGCRTMEQLDDVLGAGDLHLNDEHTQLLDDASALVLPDYPYGEMGIQQRSRPVAGGRA